MKKKDVVRRVMDLFECPKAEAELKVNQFLSVIKEGIENDGYVDFAGFVKFEKTVKPAHLAYNPKTGGKVEVPEKIVVKAKISPVYQRTFNE